MKASLGSGCPLSSKLDAKKDCTDGMAGATGTESLMCRCEAASRYHVTHASGISKIPRLPQASMSFSCKAPASRTQQLLRVLKSCHVSLQRCPRMDVNWVIERLPVTHLGRLNALGLRSENTIFHHHERACVPAHVHETSMSASSMHHPVCVKTLQHIMMHPRMAQFTSLGTNKVR